MSRYATGTGVPVHRTEAELKRTLKRYGADDIVVGESAASKQGFVQFKYVDITVRMRIALPDPQSEDFWLTPSGRSRRDEATARQAWEKACRQQWRVLLLLVKAQLEAIENGIAPPEKILMPWLVLPGGGTVGEWVLPQLEAAARAGQLKALPFPQTTEGSNNGN
jgi:hypothetical protein